VSVDPSRAAELETLAAGAGVPAAVVGRVGGDRIRITIGQDLAIDESLADAERVWSEAIGAYFDRERAIA
jgi:phosphoribosylformylglycinamidine synthase